MCDSEIDYLKKYNPIYSQEAVELLCKVLQMLEHREKQQESGRSATKDTSEKEAVCEVVK
jgi:hypothetical protein